MKLTLSFFAASVIFFAWGYGVGKTQQPCPSVEGMKPISSTTHKDGNYCSYVKVYGRATRQVKL